ncbi:MAG: amidohydrolase family protein [Spirochaetes bacterium]|nr:amidohydrolase family protein [Spirochaetota bacterium]
MGGNKTTMSRKDFLKLSAASLAYATIAGSQTGCSTLQGMKPPASDSRKGLFIRNCNIVDVEKGEIRRGQSITIIDERIVRIDEAKNPPSPDFGVMDGDNKFVIPGLIDAHCHTTLPCINGADAGLLNDILIQIDRNYVQQIHAGVTTVRDAGSAPKLLPKYLDKIKKGSIAGPRINHCTRFINIKNSHPDIDIRFVSAFGAMVLAFSGDPNCHFTDINDLKRKLALNYESKPDFVKLTMDNVSVMCGREKLDTYSGEHLKVIQDWAAERNLPVTAHIHRKFGFDRAIEYGINMEHTIGDASITDKEAGQMAAKKLSIVPTMQLAQVLCHEEQYDKLPDDFRSDYIDEELKDRRDFLYNFNDRYAQPSLHRFNMELLKSYKKYPCEELYQRKILLTKSDLYFGVLKYGPANLAKMKQAGVLIGCGTDAGVGYSYHGTIWREMEMLTRIGFSNLEALRCATLNNARILRMEDRIGSIATGKLGDLVLLGKDPLRDIRACREPLAVIKGGRIMYQSPAASRKG